MLAVLIGGVTKVHSQSAGYLRAVDDSYAAQTRVIVEDSNRLSTRFHSLLGAMPADSRTSLEFALDTLVRSTASLAREGATLATPAPSGGAGAEVAAALAGRADAMRTLRTAIDRLLGMTPLPVAGARDPSRPPARPKPLSAAGAAAELAKVGSLLARADRSYAIGRRALRRAPGGAALPSSVWSGRTTAWTSTGTLAMVNALSASATLAAVHRVELMTHTLALTPAPVPATGAAATRGISVLPPTGHVVVSVVVSNAGNVAEQGIVVHASVRGTGAGPTATSGTGTSGTGVLHQSRPRRVSLGARSSITVSLPPLRVSPDKRYTIVVTVDPPLPNTPGSVTTDAVSLRIAPPGPPTVAQLFPTKGRERGGTHVTILGSGFTWVTAVSFGTASARFKVVSSTQITAVAPPGSGTVAVHVTNSGGESPTSTADRYSYRRK